MAKLNESQIADYVRKTEMFSGDDDLTVTELSDGNINYVFRVKNRKGRSVIVKYADDRIRTSGNYLTIDRNRIETSALASEGKLAGNYVPEVYLYDRDNCLFIMEDLYDYENMRLALMQQKIFPSFASDITDFLVKTLILSTDDVTDPMEKKKQVGEFINPMLCRITERLVFSEPYDSSCPYNNYTPEITDFILQEVCNNDLLKLEVARLKNTFKNKAQSLLHGDLHTGSIFVRKDSTRVLDPEFAFYGPAGYDVGNVIANLIFAWVRNSYTAGNEEFGQWVLDTIVYVFDHFFAEGKRLLEKEATDPMARVKGYSDFLMKDMKTDSIGMTGTELIRRTIGDAQVKDLTTIEKPARLYAEKTCILLAEDMIINRAEYETGCQIIEQLQKIRSEQE